MDKTTQTQSFTKFAKAADQANVDVLLSNHQDYSYQRILLFLLYSSFHIKTNSINKLRL